MAGSNVQFQVRVNREILGLVYHAAAAQEKTKQEFICDVIRKVTDEPAVPPNLDCHRKTKRDYWMQRNLVVFIVTVPGLAALGRAQRHAGYRSLSEFLREKTIDHACEVLGWDPARVRNLVPAHKGMGFRVKAS